MKIDKCDRICAFCEMSVPIFDSDTALCEKNGIVPKNHTCRSFSYDPLKRIPPKVAEPPSLEFVDIDGDA